MRISEIVVVIGASVALSVAGCAAAQKVEKEVEGAAKEVKAVQKETGIKDSKSLEKEVKEVESATGAKSAGSASASAHPAASGAASAHPAVKKKEPEHK